MSTLFNVEKCSMLLKLALNRIRLQKNKKRELNEVRRREIANLLADGKEDQARVKVIALVHEDLMVEALAIVEVYCETIAVRLDIIAAQISCPLDMHESISGIIYAAPYFEHSPELAKIARMLMHKFGADFANEAASNKLINTRLLRALSNPLPEEGLINFYLSVISRTHEIDWSVPTVEGMARIDEALAKKGLREEANQSTSLDTDEGPELRGIFRQDAVESTWGWVTTEELGPHRPVLVMRDECVTWPSSGDNVRVQLRDPSKSGQITGQLCDEEGARTATKRHVTGVLQVDKKGNHWAVTRDAASSRTLYVFIAPKDLNGARASDHVRVELHSRADSKLSGRVISSRAEHSASTLSEQSQPRFYQGDLQQDKSGRYWVTRATPVIPGPERAELTLKRPVFVADKDVSEDASVGARVIIELHARNDDKLSARIVSVVASASQMSAGASTEFDSVLTVDSHTGMGYAVHPVTRAVHIMPTSEHLNYAQHLDHVRVTSLGTNHDQFTLGRVTRVVKPHSHTKDVIGQVSIDADGTAHVPYVTSIHRLRVDDATDQITVDIPPETVKKHNLQAGDLVMVRANRYFPTKDNAAHLHVPGDVSHVLQRAAEQSVTGVKLSAVPSPSMSLISTNDSQANDHVLFQGLESELDNTIYHVADNVRSRGAEASHVISDEPVFVLDLGEYNVRAGLHTLVNEGQTSPSLELSAMISRASVAPTMLTAPSDDFYFGFEALRRRSVLPVSSLMEHGHVLDWNHVDQFIGHVYEQLQLISAEYPVVLPLPSHISHGDISEYASILFESHVVPNLALPSQVTCLPWSETATRSAALWVDIGAGQTQVTAVNGNGHVLHHVTARTSLGGRSLATVLARDLKLEHLPWPITTQLLNHCALVEETSQLEHVIAQSGPVTLSDMEVEAGLPSTFGAERYQCPELLFDPRPLGLELEQGLSHVLARSLNRVTDQSLRAQLAQRIVLSGGVSQLHGLAARLTHDLGALMPEHVIGVQSAPSASHAVWLGAARSVHEQRYYSRDDFFEQGSRVFIDATLL